MTNDIKRLYSSGFFHIFLSSSFVKLSAFITNVIVTRLTTKDEYGSFAYAFNIFAFIVIFNGIEIHTGVLRYASKIEKSAEQILKFGLFVGITTSIVITVILAIVSSLISLPVSGSSSILFKLSFLLPLLLVLECVLSYFRAKLFNKVYSYISILNSIGLLIISIIAVKYWKITGYIFAMYVNLLITLIVCSIVISKIIIKKNIGELEIKVKREVVEYSLISSLTNFLSQLFYLIDVFLIGIIIKDSSIVAEYKIASLIPFNMIFIPSSVMTFLYPYFSKKDNNIEWIKTNYYKLIKAMILISAIILIFCLLLRNEIIVLVFGEKYKNTVPIFVILMIGFFISSSFRITSGNVLASIGYVKSNLIIAGISGVLGIIMDIIFIQRWQSIGAAISSVLMFTIISIMSNSFLYYYLKKR